MVHQDMQDNLPDILLHVCCAPCSTHPIEILKRDYRVTGFFYGPNIHPEIEYIVRLEEMERYAEMAGIKLVRAEYDMEKWFKAVEGLENESEGGERCRVCHRKVLEKTAIYALELGIRSFATTLTVSSMKDATEIHTIGHDVGKRNGLSFHSVDFKKNGGYQRCLEISKQFGLYLQDYCGCVFSRQERDARLTRKRNGVVQT